MSSDHHHIRSYTVRVKRNPIIKNCITGVVKKWDKWYWRLESSNGRILSCSETYSSYAKALQTATGLWRELQHGILIEERCGRRTLS